MDPFIKKLLCLLVFISSTSLYAETVTIAAEDDWAPYSSIGPDKKSPIGLSPEIVKAAFASQNIDVNFVVLPFARCLNSVETGKVLGCFNTTITEENKHTFYWHSTPLFNEELAIFARSDSKQSNLTQKDLEGHAVGVTIGYTYPTEFMNNPKIQRYDAPSDGNLIDMLIGKRVNYILLNTMPAYHRLMQNQNLKGKIKKVGVISLDGFWVCFSKKYPQGKRYTVLFEKGLQKIKSNGQYDLMMESFRKKLIPANEKEP